jgi:transketolase
MNVIVDNNRISMLGFTDDAVSHGNLAKRLEAFGWSVMEVDGHDVQAVHEALQHMKASANGKPKILIAETLKGHGVPFLENEPLSHVMNIRTDVLDKLLDKDK